MTARFVRALASCVLLSILLAGAGSLLLSTRAARDQTRRDVREQAIAIAGQGQAIERVIAERTGRPTGPTALLFRRLLIRVLRVNDVVLRSTKAITADAIPAAIREAGYTPAEISALQAGAVASGVTSQAWALSTYRNSTGVVAIMITDELDRGFGRGWEWLVIGGLGALAIGLATAFVLGSRVSAPIREAAANARAIASGDLTRRMTTGGRDELSDLARAVNELADGLATSRGRERQLLASVSHDLRTPLTAISGWAEALADQTAPDPAAAGRVIAQQSQHLTRLVGDLLDMARAGAGQLGFHHSRVDLAAVAQAALDARQTPASKGALDLILRSPARTEFPETQQPLEAQQPPEALIDADRNRVEQVITNLLDNALKFAASRVELDLESSATEVKLHVSDDGPGLAPELIDRAFEPFLTDDRGDPRRHGTGLGLAVARELTKAMGGTIAFDPTFVGGARVTLSFPPADLGRPDRPELDRLGPNN
jgi:signal transduction histidine kinase